LEVGKVSNGLDVLCGGLSKLGGGEVGGCLGDLVASKAKGGGGETWVGVGGVCGGELEVTKA